MRQVLLTILIAMMLQPLYAEQKIYQSPMSLYNDNYFITGDKDKEQVKFQFSAMYNVIYPYELLYFGYTQRSWWKIYDKSSPFVETNYMPEIFLRFTSGKNIVNNVVIPFVDYIQVSPIFHKSNGRDEENSRSMNIYYGQLQISAGDVLNVGANVKAYKYYNVSKRNLDINDYNKNYEATIFLKIRSKTVLYFDKEELRVTFAGDPRDKGYYQIEGAFRILTSYIQPRLFFQYRKGYDEWMVDYNKKTESYRLGLVF